MQSFKATGSAGASGAAVTLSCSGYGGFAAQVIGTYSGTLTFEGSIDGENFSVVTMTPIAFRRIAYPTQCCIWVAVRSSKVTVPGGGPETTSPVFTT